jgi:hypothetical protein
VLETCSTCHDAHRFHAEGQDCRACHTDPAQPGRVTPPAPARVSTPAPTAHPLRTSSRSAAGGVRMLAALLLPGRAMAQQPATTPPFEHAVHTDVDCLACHTMDESHGRLSVTSLRDCRACHHTGATAQPCARCHTGSDAPADVYDVRRAYQPSVGRAENRTWQFEHGTHDGVACAECHREGPALSAARINCSACHTEHHAADNNCIACHQTPPASAHTRTAHLTCEGSGCHAPAPVAAAERTRSLCLACHQDLTDHQPGRTCVNCHTLPPARAAAAASGPG